MDKGDATVTERKCSGVQKPDPSSLQGQLHRLSEMVRCSSHAADREPSHETPMDGVAQAVDQAAAGLGCSCVEEVGADRSRGMEAEQSKSNGVISDPPPTPVIPTSVPTAKPEIE
jgi:hypothetical protein